jgi:hypothetical protein
MIRRMLPGNLSSETSFRNVVAVRLLWLKIYAPVVETAASTSSEPWSEHDPSRADGVFSDDDATEPDGAVPPSGWAVRSPARRVAPWTTSSTGTSGTSS